MPKCEVRYCIGLPHFKSTHHPCGRLWKSVPQRGGGEFSNVPAFCVILDQDNHKGSKYFIWNSHSLCVTCFLNVPQGVCGIQMELPIASHRM